ncbi:LacI family transcriptional regulator [Paenibacillus larvae subsp. pulvifaciens]|uniref:LacI family transcriptional regulator n=3 Tax=Paenibacillus larvae TaxID=1464 RepID=A0A1V0USJ2_9BACL|nr:LacI family DNA-binding transcriptional regulator [Paenibacillus larvae]ARF67932.1 LacI family transcriptional regulator [Paenibacillus larvae subsp. pulvifaciens]QHZ53477.1 HTH-type transcriptional repressor PurR [Paenibacillus larvae subsp. larvae]
MKINILDVAKKAGVSVVTVSRVLNNTPSVREKNRQKVLRAIKELDYRPNSAARSLARGKTGVIGLTLTTLQDSVFDGIVKSVNEELEGHGYFLALSIHSDLNNDPPKENNFLFQEDRVDGIIALSPMDEEHDVLELKRKKIPFVLLDNQNEDLNASMVNVDNDLGGRLATKHLIELGHRKIAHISGQELFMSTKERRKGYLNTMVEAGLEPWVTPSREFNMREGFRIAKDWIRTGNVPSAVFAADDFLAFGVMEAFRDEGYRIPHDISVIGYDDQSFAEDFHPGLTTIRQPVEQMAQQAVRLLLKIIDGTLKRNTSSKLEPELIIRESTGRYRKA